MESLDDGKKTVSGFFRNIITYEKDEMGDAMNLVQFTVLAIIPIFVLNKLVQNYIPQVDEEKGSLEILVEVILQVVVIYGGLLIIKRAIYYIPTYSGYKYPEMSIIFQVLVSLLAFISMRTKLGEKCNILWDRLMNAWNGRSGAAAKKGKAKKGATAVQQGFTQQTSSPVVTMGAPQPTFDEQAAATPMMSQPQQQQQQQLPQVQQQMEPMAANDALGGSFSGFAAW